MALDFEERGLGSVCWVTGARTPGQYRVRAIRVVSVEGVLFSAGGGVATTVFRRADVGPALPVMVTGGGSVVQFPVTSTLTFDASSAYDPNAAASTPGSGIASYAWTYVGDNGAGVVLSDRR
jgi:hypothetical protein